MKTFDYKSILVIILLIFVQQIIYAIPGGIAGRTLKSVTTGCGGSGCHTSSITTGLSIVIAGPTTLTTGQTGNYTCTMTYTSLSKSGIDIAASSGILATTDSRLKILSAEVVQRSSISGSGSLVLNFSYTAPSTAGNQTLYATGCGVKNSWNHAANFTVNVTSGSPTLTITSPIGGENWLSGTTQNITWTSTLLSNIKIEYTTDNGGNWVTVISSVPATPSSYLWNVPNTPSTQCKVRVSDVTNATISSVCANLFTIVSSPTVMDISHLRQNDINGVSQDTGLTVVITGIVSVGNELNSPSYIQDTTGGLAVYGRGATAFSGQVKIGDMVQVTGKVVNYNGLTEISPVTAFTKLDSGKIVTPLELTIPQVLNQQWNGFEKYEGSLIKINYVTLVNAVSSWAGNTNYKIKNGVDTLDLRITTGTNLVGQTVPAGLFDVIGVLSQYKTTAPYNTGYQLIPRFLQDVVSPTYIGENELSGSRSFSLSQNYPNPFNPSTIISFQLSELRNVTIKIYDALSREIEILVNEQKPAGKYSVEWNAMKYSSGIYYYELNTGNFREMKKMILIK